MSTVNSICNKRRKQIKVRSYSKTADWICGAHVPSCVLDPAVSCVVDPAEASWSRRLDVWAEFRDFACCCLLFKVSDSELMSFSLLRERSASSTPATTVGVGTVLACTRLFKIDSWCIPPSRVGAKLSPPGSTCS